MYGYSDTVMSITSLDISRVHAIVVYREVHTPRPRFVICSSDQDVQKAKLRLMFDDSIIKSSVITRGITTHGITTHGITTHGITTQGIKDV